MTEPHQEPSYYEIALTNRQVVIAFAVLLVCLVTAFFSGVWVGREGAGPTEEAQAAAAAPPREGAALEEFEFFEEGEGRAAGAAAAPQAEPPAPEPEGPTTLREDLEGGAPRELGDDPVEPEEEAEPAPDDTAADEPEPAPVPAVRPPPPPPVSPEPARDTGGTAVIQVFSSAEEDQATRIRDRLASAGYKAYLSPVDVAGRTMYRVRIGPFSSRAKAQEVAERVRKSHRLDTWVTE
ncbi:MAG TPA: SPOR domain-containing protein [Thermoanaerobaculia bacterium]|nr:SPOR domain-containing protein [Thermoanaerobaculia bacterium]